MAKEENTEITSIAGSNPTNGTLSPVQGGPAGYGLGHWTIEEPVLKRAAGEAEILVLRPTPPVGPGRTSAVRHAEHVRCCDVKHLFINSIACLKESSSQGIRCRGSCNRYSPLLDNRRWTFARPRRVTARRYLTESVIGCVYPNHEPPDNAHSLIHVIHDIRVSAAACRRVDA